MTFARQTAADYLRHFDMICANPSCEGCEKRLDHLACLLDAYAAGAMQPLVKDGTGFDFSRDNCEGLYRETGDPPKLAIVPRETLVRRASYGGEIEP